MTDRQKAVLAYLREFHAREDRLPTTREISRHFEFSQTAAVHHLRALENHGAIERREGRGNLRFAREAVS